MIAGILIGLGIAGIVYEAYIIPIRVLKKITKKENHEQKRD